MPALRRTAFAALAAALALTLGSRAGAQTVVVGPRAAGVAASPGGLVTVPVVADLSASGGASLGSVTGRLTWRTSTLGFLGSSIGTAGPVVVNVDTTVGELRFALANAAGATGTPTLVSVSFQARGAIGDTTTLGLTLSEITAAGTFADLLPITSVTTARFCVAGGRYGDIDGNDTLKSNDALLIVTSAVGLPIPYSTANGDVDGDGQVNTRDALIVLSYVVGLPTGAFRVARLNTGSCSVRGPASVAIQPMRSPIEVGDQLPLAALVRDSTGAVINAQALVWSSRDTNVARVSTLGLLIGIAPGTTRVLAIVAPGLMDSATVTVTVAGSRRRWYVDQAIAAANSIENGSPQYPFSTLQQAVDRAGARDTVMVTAAGTYTTGALVTKPLTIMGNPASPAAPRFGGPILIDSLADTIRLQRLVIADAQSGVHAQGRGRLFLDSVVVERARGRGIAVRGLAELSMRRSAVNGAVDAGVSADSVSFVRLDSVRVEGVAGGAETGKTLEITRADSLRVSDALLWGGTAKLLDVLDVNVFAAGFQDAAGPLLEVRGATNVVLDSVQALRPGGSGGPAGVDIEVVPGSPVTLTRISIQEVAETALRVHGASTLSMSGGEVRRRAGAFASGAGSEAALIQAVGATRIDNVTFANGALVIVDSANTMRSAALTGANFENAWLFVNGLDTLTYAGGSMNGPVPLLVEVDSTTVVSLVGFEARGGGARTAVSVAGADSVRVDSLWVHDNAIGALGVSTARVLTASGNRFENNHRASRQYGATVQVSDVSRIGVRQSVFDDRVDAGAHDGLSVGSVGGGSIAVDSNTFYASQYAVSVYGLQAGTDTAVFRGNLVRPASGGRGGGLIVGDVGRVEVLGNAFDSLRATSSIMVTNSFGASRGMLIASNVLTGVSMGVVASSYVRQLVEVTGNTVSCAANASGSTALGVAADTTAIVSGNTLRGCSRAIDVFGGWVFPQLPVVRNNIIQTDTANGDVGIAINGYVTSPEVVGNDITGRLGDGGVLVSGGYGITSGRVDSNVVHDATGHGIHLRYSMSGVVLRGNRVERIHAADQNVSGWAGINLENGASVRLVDNRVLQNSVAGIVQNSGYPLVLDSNVIADDSLEAISVRHYGAVSGVSNRIVRNRYGLTGTVNALSYITVSQSIFDSNLVAGASGPASWNLADNWWGSATGPRCGVGCPGALGDSVAGVTFLPFLTAPPSGVPIPVPMPGPNGGLRIMPATRAAGATRAVTVPMTRAAPTRPWVRRGGAR